jgi:hypothetical protein
MRKEILGLRGGKGTHLFSRSHRPLPAPASSNRDEPKGNQPADSGDHFNLALFIQRHAAQLAVLLSEMHRHHDNIVLGHTVGR